ncbi:MAG: ABC-F family ATP-binding cassette domain-containing protein [Anaerolineae bacterium]|nr:ABC-F family ATP-binding cassette domain-containing protein [Anaerolineae bacterium]
MSLITLENISKQYSERLLLDRVGLQINEGDRIGLIGINGSGKSTFLRLVAGLETPDNGSIVVRGGIQIQYLPQEPDLNDELTVLAQVFDSDSPPVRLLRDYEWASQQLQQQPDSVYWQEQLTALSDRMEHSGGWAAEANAKAILTRLGITDFAAPIATLSGGQRKRVALARALIDRADLLILDEPTNHIDAETIAWLEAYLLSQSGALLMVTHDRYFLDRVVNRIIELDRRQLVSYPGNYSQYLELSTARRETLASAEVKRQNLLRRELEWLRRGAQARSTKQKARKQRVEELQRLAYDRGDQIVSMALAGRRLGKKVLQARGLSKTFEGRLLFTGVEFYLEPGDRIGIIGPNGAGKSTLLNILAGKVAPDTGMVKWGETVHLGYYDQQSSGLDESRRVIDFIEQEAPLIRTKDGSLISAFQILEWFLFPRPQQYAYIGTLSGGERRRLYLLYTLIHQPNVLFLDEPTNDLDIQTLTVLEEFLDHFQGCLVVASHDRYFLDRTTDFLVSFEDGRVSARYPAPFETYLQLRAEQAVNAPSRAETSIAHKAENKARPRKLSWKEQQELDGLEPRIEQLEAQKAALQAEINASGSDYVRLQSLAERLHALEAELEAAEERWLELSEVID